MDIEPSKGKSQSSGSAKEAPASAAEQSQALGKVQLATERLVKGYPLHAAVLGRMKLACDYDCPTMGVSLFGDKETWEPSNPVWLLYNPTFVLKIKLRQLVGVLLHEINHVLFDHLLMEDLEYPNRRALIVAQEVTVNEFVKEPLPKGCILLKQYPYLPKMESTKQRYDRLKSEVEESKIIVYWDVDGLWGKGMGHIEKEAAKKAIRDMIEAAASGTRDLPKDLLKACRKHGNSTSAASETISSGEGKPDWHLLKRFVGQITEPMPTYSRPSRRMPELLGIIPGKMRLGDKPKIMAVIDTSNSITNELLATINRWLTALAKDYQVYVVECDIRIHREYRFKGGLENVVGRGGTDLRPPLNPRFLSKHRPDVVVYFTDGYGPAPKVAPKVPLVWCLTANGTRPVPWGLVVQMV